MKHKIFSLLNSTDTYISGETMSRQLGISRSAVWKYIKKLREEGYQIESVTNKGYHLSNIPDLLTEELLSIDLNTRLLGKKICCFEEIDSTNNEAKRCFEYPDGTVFISEIQTFGKGRTGKAWTSPKGVGIWMSFLVKPNLLLDDVSQLTLVAGLGVCKALKNTCGVDAKIKWPNDIVIGSKKICGILTEMSAEIDQLNYIVCGIGINVNIASFSNDIADRATSLLIETGKVYNRGEIIKETLRQIEALYFIFLKNGLSAILEEYKKYCVTLYREVKIIKEDSALIANAIDVNENGELIVEYNGIQTAVKSGEVSVRGIYDYI